MNNAEKKLFKKCVKIRKQLEDLAPRLTIEDKMQLDGIMNDTTITYYNTDISGKQMIFEKWRIILSNLQTKYPARPKLRLVK